MSRRESLFRHVTEHVIVGVVREEDVTTAWSLARAYAEHGIKAIEITLTTPDALNLISRVATTYGDRGIIVAAGTTRGANAAAEARRAGAQILVSPHTDLSVIEYAMEHDLFCIAGAATATEIIHAWEAGASLIKVYPAGLLGGPKYIETIRQPIRDVPLLAGGPVQASEIEAYLAAGAVGLNLAAALAPRDLIRAGDWTAIGAKIEETVAMIRSFRDAGATVARS